MSVMELTNQTTEEPIILVPTNKGIRVIGTHRIIRVQSVGSYSKLFFADGTNLLVAKVLLYFETLLPPHQFIRIHRTHLVNKYYMQTILLLESPKLLLQNGELVSISRRKRKSVLSMLQNPVINRA
jgi:two-component system, LytTR family, response regulator